MIELPQSVQEEVVRQEREYPVHRSHRDWMAYAMQELGEVERAISFELGERTKPVDMTSQQELEQLIAVLVRARLQWGDEQPTQCVRVRPARGRQMF